MSVLRSSGHRGPRPVLCAGLSLGALAIALGSPGSPSASESDPRDLQELRDVVERLAADDMRGRGAGSPELESSGQWIRAEFEKAGLAPGHGDGFLQPVVGPSGEELFNVVGKVEGHGAEYVVVGAHYDGLGIGEPGSEFPGEVHNGADDNASGVAALLRIARRIASERDLDRTVYLVAFTGEEIGRLGSTTFVDSPPAPLSAAAAMLNLDTVGRVEADRLIVFGTATAEEFEDMLRGVNYAFGFDLAFQSEGAGASDHSPFFAKGIPVLHFFSGARPEYHRPGDDAALINYPGLDRIADFVAEVALYLAATEVPLRFRPAGVGRLTESAPSEPKKRRVSFGSIPDFSRESGGILLSGVMPGSAAEAADLRAGDLLVELDGVSLDTIYDFQAALAAHEPGDVVVVRFVREGSIDEAEVTLRERK